MLYIKKETLIMKKSIIAVVLAIATLVTFIIPASAWSWDSDGKFEVASYNAALVEAGTIKVDCVKEDAYLDGDMISSYQDETPYKRGEWNDHPEIQELADANFIAYVAVDTDGMYIYAEIEDATIFDADRDGNANEGDMLQLYFDWCEPNNEDPMYDMVHPSATAMYNQYLLEGVRWEQAFNYRSMYGATGMMYLGWVAGDYHNVVTGAWGFSPYNALGMYADKAIEYASDLTSSGWKCEWFIPWRDEEQSAKISRGEQFHCGLGFQAADDSDLYDVVDYQEGGVSVPEKSIGIRFDQRREIGLGYYINYASLADIRWGEYPEGYLREEEETLGGEEIDTSDSIIAVVAALAVAGAGVVLFSRKKED